MTIKKLYPIVISAKRESWRMLDSHADEADARYSAVRQKVLQRDNHTCRFCGFRAERFQEVHHLDHVHGNNKAENLATACCFCHMNFHLGMAGLKDAASVIWCPELSQANINILSRAIFVAVANHGRFEDAARRMYESMEARSAIVKEEIGDGAINPASIGQAFLEMSPEQYESRKKRLHGLRLLPKMRAFSKQIAYWQSDTGVFAGLQDEDWERFARDPEASLGATT